MSDSEDDLDDAWGDEPAAPAAPASSVPAKPVSSAPRPASANPPRPASSNPPRPSSSNPPRPSSTPPKTVVSAPPLAAPSTPPTRGIMAHKATLIGIPAPAAAPPADKASQATPAEGLRMKLPSERAPAATTTESNAPAAGSAEASPSATTPRAASTAPSAGASVAPAGATASPPAEPAEKASAEGDTESTDKDGDGGSKPKRPFSDTRADTPRAKDERSRTSAPLRVSVPPPDAGSSMSRWLMLSLVLAALIMGGRWYLQSRDTGAPPPAPAVDKAPAAAAPVAEALPTVDKAAPAAAAESAAPAAGSAAAEASAAPAAGSAAVEASAAPAPEATPPAPSAGAAPSPSASATTEAPGSRTVIVKISPTTARLFYHGKPVGSSPVTVVLAPGEKKRSFEVGGPGWVTRRLVVDGSKPEIFIGLKPSK